jgi:diaminohydroxyphosphoribosylaminopyrimidine deaminase/5-amino-6-(5-phosphoribosylamino)uracil reductase
MHADHEQYMQAALSLARRNLGQTWPNPSVGAVIVKDGYIIAEGYTARGGRPHAETQALEQAGAQAKDATLYVSLEPCSHHGKTPPCTEAVIRSGIRHVVSACTDPNPQVSGKGIAQLKAAGIEVTEGICRNEASALNRGFFSVITRKRPFISLKIATSLDGKIATGKGESKWITAAPAREYAHMIRSQYDAVATGIGTVLADDPQLTCRLSGLEDKSPVRIVFDSKLRLPEQSKLAQNARKLPVWCLHAANEQNKSLESLGIKMLASAGKERIDIAEAMSILAQQGITRLLVEAGAVLSTAFLQSGLVDRMYWFRAPLVIGNDGLAAFGGSFSPALSQLARWHAVEHVTLPPDSMDVLECSPVS